MLKRTLTAAAVALVLLAGAVAPAQVLNGGFEADGNDNPLISEWSRFGHGFTSDTTRFSTPTQGRYQATLATELDGSFGERAGDGADRATAEAVLGLKSTDFTAVGNGNVAQISAIAQTVRLGIGDTFFFDANFLTNSAYNTGDEFSNRPSAAQNDFAFLSFSMGGASGVTKLVDTFDGYVDVDPTNPSGFFTGFATTPETDPFVGETGYRTYSFTATAAGDYLFGIGVADAFTGAQNPGVNSGLLVDNVRVVPAVPEPASFAAIGIGLAALARRRKRA